jgi:hypothetical protein
MSNHLSSAEQQRFRYLQGRQADFSISDTEQQELNGLIAKGRQAITARQDAIAGVKKAVSELNIGITELFSGSEILSAAAQTPRNVGKAPKPGKRSGSPLIRIEGGTRVFAYHQGQQKPYFLPKTLEGLKSHGIVSADTFAPYVTDAGKAYFATDAGAKEFERFIAWVNRSNPKPKE